MLEPEPKVDEDFKTRARNVDIKKYQDKFDEIFEDLDADLLPHVMARIATWHLTRYFQYVDKRVSAATIKTLAAITKHSQRPLISLH